MANPALSNAKNAKKDEFYTQLEDINAEMVHYEEQFKDKVVFMNCDDPTSSNFWRYFHMEFERLGLKKIIATHYEYDLVPSYKMEYCGGNDEDFEEGTKTELTQNGDFRSDECIELLKEADIVVTNPPFSLFREYIAQLMQYEKKFIIIGNINALTYKEVFPLVKSNKVWLGHKDLATSYYYAKRDTLYPELYPKYDNYEAINIDKTNEIPMDYNGIMGVPITFMDKYNPDQFEIINLSRYLNDSKGMTKEFVDDYYAQGNKGQICEGHPDLCYYTLDRKAVVPYMRILIRVKRE